MVATFALNHRRVRAPNLNERADEDLDKGGVVGQTVIAGLC